MKPKTQEMNCKRLLVASLAAAATALVFVINVVFFCRKRGAPPGAPASKYRAGKDAASSSESEGLLDSDHHQLQEAEHDDLHQQRNQQLTDAAIKEEQAGSGRASLQAPHSTSTLLRRSVRDGKSQESGQKALVSVAEAKAVAGPGKSVQGPAQASPTKSAPAKGPAAEQASSVHLPDPHSPPVLPESEKPAGKRAKVLQEPGPSPAAAEQVDVGFLQGLIDTELGPPKFAMAKPKPPPSPARHMPGDSVGSGSLQELLNQEFGAPRFAVPKTNATASPAKPAAAAEAAVLSPSAATRAPTSADRPHLRLEVLSGPATGHVFDTMDVAAEHHVGRYQDSALALPDDQEVSGKHAVILFSASERRWKLTDVGSLNGTLLNGVLISNEYRQPGKPHALTEGDVVEFGGSTRVLVSCFPSPPPQPRGVSLGGAATASPGSAAATAAVVPSSASEPGRNGGGAHSESSDRRRFRSASLQVLSNLEPHLAVQEFSELGISLAVHQRLGSDHKRTNTGCEDVAFWEVPFEGNPQCAALAIFDGHHGAKAASKARELVPAMLKEKVAAAGGGLILGRAEDAQHALLRALFLEADAQMAIDEGCTATLVLLQRDPEDGAMVIQTANVGDSSAVLVTLPPAGSTTGLQGAALATPSSSSPTAAAAAQQGAQDAGAGSFSPAAHSHLKLTADHRIASSAAERSRLQQRGHTVKTRLYGLNISRMLGDRFLKDEDLGFLAEPHVSHPQRVGGSSAAGGRAFIMVASDGLWDVVGETRAAGLVAKAAEEDPRVSAADIADILLSQAVTLRSKDDITVVVAEIRV